MLRDDEIVEILKLVDFKISKSELGAFFRKDDHPNYLECGDQILRNFLNGLVIHLRGTKENPTTPAEALSKKRKPQQQNSSNKSNSKVNRKPSFKEQQLKRINKDLGPTKFKNKKKS